ncbi:MAG: hypothetical protein KKA65_02050 [Nanoarchaeota archaeon]|nr:hypothetical protein [Nanoarchaeota archaeon]MCG2720239.1 hypothetical protein [Nanoarchaeota archaeon]
MNKKGQITLFIILGIILIAVVILGFTLKDKFMKTRSEDDAALIASLPPDIAEVRKEIDSCSQFVLEEAILEVGNYGGYNSPLENSLEVEDVFVTYGYLEGRNVLPTISVIEEEINEYVETFLPDCANLESFDFEISSKNPNVKVEILDGKVIAEVNYEVTIIKEGNEFKIDNPYYSEVEVKFKEIYDLALDIINKIAQEPTQVDISYLLDLGWDIDVVPVDDKTVVYSIPDTESILSNLEGETNFVYAFATKA